LSQPLVGGAMKTSPASIQTGLPFISNDCIASSAPQATASHPDSCDQLTHTGVQSSSNDCIAVPAGQSTFIPAPISFRVYVHATL